MMHDINYILLSVLVVLGGLYLISKFKTVENISGNDNESDKVENQPTVIPDNSTNLEKQNNRKNSINSEDPMTCNCWPVYQSNGAINSTYDIQQHQPGGNGHAPLHYGTRHGKRPNSSNVTSPSSLDDSTVNNPYSNNPMTRQSITGYFTETGTPGAPGYLLTSPSQ